MKLRAPKGEGALAIHELDGFTTGLIAMPGRPLLRAERFGVGGLLDRIVGVFGRGQHLRRAAAAPAARSGRRQRCAGLPRGGVSRAARRDRRCRLRDAGRAAAVRCADLDSRARHADARRPQARRQRRALLEAAGADGAAVRGSPRRGARDARARRSPAVQHDTTSAIAFRNIRSPTARPRSRSCARSPRSARAIAIVRFTIAPARRWRASSI